MKCCKYRPRVSSLIYQISFVYLGAFGAPIGPSQVPTICGGFLQEDVTSECFQLQDLVTKLFNKNHVLIETANTYKLKACNEALIKMTKTSKAKLKQLRLA